MFTSQLKMYGKHAYILKKYSKDSQAAEPVKFTLKDYDGNLRDVVVFDSMIKCFIFCAALGFAEKRIANEDKSVNVDANIFADVFNANRKTIERIYKQIVLSDESISKDDRIKKIFKKMSQEEDKAAEQIILSYVRGGLEILDEQLKDSFSYETFATNFLELISRYNLETE